MVFCSKCGNEIEPTTRFCPNCGSSIENTNPSRMNRKKIIISVGLAFVLLAIWGVASNSPPKEYKESNISEIITENPNLIINTLQEMLPTRDDIGTKWIMGDTNNVTAYYLEETGFLEGIEKRYTAMSGYEGDNITVTLFRFDSVEHTSKVYTDEILDLREKGGFIGFLPSVPADACYGSSISVVYSQSITKIRCHKNVIFFTVESHVYGDYEDSSEQFAQMVAQKIN